MKKIAGTILIVATGFCLNSSLINDSKTNPVHRQTIEQIKGEKGTVKQAGEGEEAVYIIDCSNKYLRLHVCNMPVAFQKNGLQVTFSGNIKASSTLEDDFGELFEITEVK